MMTSIHFLRPYWLVGFLPLYLVLLYVVKKPTARKKLEEICDKHLLPYLVQTFDQRKRHLWLCPTICLSFMLFGLSGPAFVQLPVPVFKSQQTRVIVSDFSDNMLAEDITPSRLQRAKFKLHDLFQQKEHVGQFGLIVFSGEAFVAAPLTEDTHTIDTLLETLAPDMMPVSGNHLESALLEAAQCIQQAGRMNGSVLVITAETPTPEAIKTAEKLAKNHISVSILPLLPLQKLNHTFKIFADAGKGQVYPFTETSDDIVSWEKKTRQTAYATASEDQFPRWRDDGRWFLIPSLISLLPLFRKNYFVEGEK